MSTVVVHARAGFIGAAARVAAIALHRVLKRQLESWNPTRFFKKGENPNFPPDSPMQPSRASAQILRQYAPLRLLSVGSIASAPRVASAAEMAALILNPARHGAREMRPLARAAGFRQYARVLLAACSLLNRGTRMLLRVWRRRYLEARSLCMSLQDNNSDRHHHPECACPSAVIRIGGAVASCRFASGRSCLPVAGSDSIRQADSLMIAILRSRPLVSWYPKREPQSEKESMLQALWR